MNHAAGDRAKYALGHLICILALSGCAVNQGKNIRGTVTSQASAGSPEFRQSMGPLLGHGFVPGNNIQTLRNGDQIFPSMLDAIRHAKRSINFETYVYTDGDIGRKLADALVERAKAGVAIHVILDAQGTSHAGADNLSRMRNAGVMVEKYHTMFWWDVRRYNNRTHRKLLIVDGRVGFIGGVGIADEWEGNAESPKYWRDNHYKVTGPVVAQLQSIFMENWLKTAGTLLNGPDYFPSLAATGPYQAQAFKSSPHEGDIDVQLMYLYAVTSARHSLRIENAYFLPDRRTREALIAAAQRGVKVEILVPGSHIDQKLVRHASRRYWPGFIKAGIRIYEYEPTMVHVKLLIADDMFTSVGSANFDSRSIRLNDEANLNVFDRGFAAQQTRLFEQDKRRSREMRLDKEGGMLLEAPVQQVAGATASQL